MNHQLQYHGLTEIKVVNDQVYVGVECTSGLNRAITYEPLENVPLSEDVINLIWNACRDFPHIFTDNVKHQFKRRGVNVDFISRLSFDFANSSMDLMELLMSNFNLE